MKLKVPACTAQRSGVMFAVILAALYLLIYAPMPKKWSLDKYTMLLRIAYIPTYCSDIKLEEIEQYTRNITRKKRVLLWTPNFSRRNWGLPLGSEAFLNCPETRCEVVTDRCLQPVSDALAFHLPVTSASDMPSTHPLWQVWVATTAESAAWRQPWLGSRKKLNGKFNLTATYRWDSDFYTPYFVYHKLIDNGSRIMSKQPSDTQIHSMKDAPDQTHPLHEQHTSQGSRKMQKLNNAQTPKTMQAFDDHSFQNTIDISRVKEIRYRYTPVSKSLFLQRKDRRLPDTTTTDYTTNKTGLVLWFVSNCRTKRTKTRIRYAKELAKHIPINVYGSCRQAGAKPDPCKRDQDCVTRMMSQHKFYLSFENARCHWYISEKFSRPLEFKAIPVALGAPLQEYEVIAPKDSFLHVDNFTSPKGLADYMKYLDSNDEAYNKYFEWRKHYITGYKTDDGFWCNFCAKLWNPGQPQVYRDFSTWFGEKENCR